MITNIPLDKLNAYHNYLKKQFKNNDVFQTTEDTYISHHYHDDEEYRLFLSGECVFSIDGVEIYPKKGDMLRIPKGTVHSFSYDSSSGEPLIVARFFGESDSHVTHYIKD